LAARKKKNEKLAADTRYLIGKAYPNANVVVREEMAVDYFVQAFVGKEIRLQVRRAACGFLDEALSEALSEENYLKLERPAGRVCAETCKGGLSRCLSRCPGCSS
jgi:hypothetical protein